MAPVNTIIPPTIPPVVRRRPVGKKKLPDSRRRVILSARVLPATKEYLENMGYGNNGRALDLLVQSVQHAGVAKMMEAGVQPTIVNLAV